MRAVAALLVVAAGLVGPSCATASASPGLDPFLAGLPSALTTARSPDELHAALSDAPAEVSQGPGDTLHFPGRDAGWLMNAWHLDGVYAVATDPHQESWQLMRFRHNVADANGNRIAVAPITFGIWTVRPLLAGRPGGDLPNVVAGASPAYDIADHPAQVVGIDLEM